MGRAARGRARASRQDRLQGRATKASPATCCRSFGQRAATALRRPRRARGVRALAALAPYLNPQSAGLPRGHHRRGDGARRAGAARQLAVLPPRFREPGHGARPGSARHRCRPVPSARDGPRRWLPPRSGKRAAPGCHSASPAPPAVARGAGTPRSRSAGSRAVATFHLLPTAVAFAGFAAERGEARPRPERADYPRLSRAETGRVSRAVVVRRRGPDDALVAAASRDGARWRLTCAGAKPARASPALPLISPSSRCSPGRCCAGRSRAHRRQRRVPECRESAVSSRPIRSSAVLSLSATSSCRP